MPVAPRRALLGLCIALTAALSLAGCAQLSPTKADAPWSAATAHFEADDGQTFSLGIGPVRSVLTQTDTWRTALPLVINVDEDDPQGQATIWLGLAGEIVRKDWLCTRIDEGECGSANINFNDAGDPAPYAVGLLGRDSIHADGKALPVQRHGSTVEVGPYAAFEAGGEPVRVRASFDSSPLPLWVKYTDSEGRVVKQVKRTSLIEGPALGTPGAPPPGEPSGPLNTEYRVFPGEQVDVLRRGYPPIEPLDALLAESSDARRLFEAGCVVQLYIHPNVSPRSFSEQVPALWSRASDFAEVQLAESGGDSIRWILGRYEDAVGRSEWRVDASDERPPISCTPSHANHHFALDASVAMDRFEQFALTYQASPGFSLEYRGYDHVGTPDSQLSFAVSAIPEWVNLTQSNVGWQPHTVRIDVDTGHYRMIQFDPDDADHFERPA